MSFSLATSQLSLCLPLSAEADAVPTLADYLSNRTPDVVLAGKQAEGGEDSGFVPYLLGEMLGYSLVPDVLQVEFLGRYARMLQALPHGQRRWVRCAPPIDVLPAYDEQHGLSADDYIAAPDYLHRDLLLNKSHSWQDGRSSFKIPGKSHIFYKIRWLTRCLLSGI